jgi:hypothetical protein
MQRNFLTSTKLEKAKTQSFSSGGTAEIVSSKVSCHMFMSHVYVT